MEDREIETTETGFICWFTPKMTILATLQVGKRELIHVSHMDVGALLGEPSLLFSSACVGSKLELVARAGQINIICRCLNY